MYRGCELGDRRNEISVEGAEGKIRISGVKGRCCRERRGSYGNVEEILKKKRNIWWRGRERIGEGAFKTSKKTLRSPRKEDV